MKYFTEINKSYWLLSMNFCSLAVYAVDSVSKQMVARELLIPSAKGMANKNDATNSLGSIFDFEQGFIQLIKVLVVLGGVAFLFSSIQAYVKHRNSPVESPWSRVFMLFFIGLGLIALSFVPIKI